MDLFSLRA